MKVRSLLQVATLLVILLTGANSRGDDSPPLDLRTVPALKGCPIDEARQRARLADLTLAAGVFYIAPQNWRDEIVPRAIYIQSPQPGALAPAGASIAGWTFVQADSKQAVVKMPDLRGTDGETALRKLAELKLLVLIAAGTDEPAQQWQVLDHYPKPNQSIYEGTSVYLVPAVPVE